MSGEHGFQVPTTPIAPDRDRRPWLVVLLLVVLIGGAFALARLTSEADRGRVTTLPAEAEISPEPTATPLPLLQWFTGSEAPLDDIWLEAGQVRRLELADARLADMAIAVAGRDLLMPAPRGGTVCLCWQAAGAESGGERRLDLVRRGGDEREISRTTITSVNGLDPSEPPEGPTRVALEPSPDGRFAYLARATRSATRWRVSLDVIDLVSGTIVDTIDLSDDPSTGRTRILSIALPRLRAAPDGRHVLVTAGVERDPLIGPGSTPRAWIVELDGGRIAQAVAADALVDPYAGSCQWIDFATSELIAQGGCEVRVEGADPAPEIRRHDLEGRDLGALVVARWRARNGELLLDATRGIAYAWDPDARLIGSVDLVEGVERSIFDSSLDEQAPDAVVASGQRPGAGQPTTWADGRSATDARGQRTLIGSPDGRLLFVVGTGSGTSTSSGVWVFDAQSLEVIERWPAAAAYSSIALLEDGRWLAAIGRPGVTATGSPAAWGTSLTVHDATTGRPIVIVGDLRTDAEVSFAWMDPPASFE